MYFRVFFLLKVGNNDKCILLSPTIWKNDVAIFSKHVFSLGGGNQVCTGVKNLKWSDWLNTHIKLTVWLQGFQQCIVCPISNLQFFRYLWKCAQMLIFRECQLYRGKNWKMVQIWQKWAHIFRWVTRIKTRNSLYYIR